ncbi:hypothetical protein SMACR_02902 [Sordaria macrospora]|uniref:WGS project CABT00000000 data, contig 2.12 n=2 Tax=Sordaria macrospora TaxID=5147 RepID=F7VXT3_SORMK|nr:uncharacterized protein SMAC_02902 [Sordaria macrospora k-hell]KAA8629942.1 hypothetical protein SMACR_02902 [Sordaria macrospora]WPJ58259.1 hypothetical protein SMAC4_02902 [Sordaria macrospora]CCC10327.1 unnamed protein product [Sordaria macrospora k-hell]
MASSFSNSFTLEPAASEAAAAASPTTDESGRQSSPSVAGSEQTTKSTNTNINKNKMAFSSASHYINDDLSHQGDHHPYNDSAAPSSDEDGNHIMGNARFGSPAAMAKLQTASSKIPKSRRRGTATTIKAPRRARAAGGGAKKGTAKGAATIGGGGGSRKKTDTSMTTTLPNEIDDGGSLAGSLVGGQDGGGGSGMSESDSGPYCICGGPDNHRFMIACDRCEDWFHGECINMDKYTGENLVQRYICPRCEIPDRGLVTRYKKMCSLDGCNQPAKIYEDAKEERSIFCSPEHCNAWWDQLVATLPRTREVGMDNLTRQEFMGILNPPETKPGHGDPPWHLGDEPFGVPPNFWKTADLGVVLTPEERSILDRSAADRYALGEEIGLCKKMLQLLDMAVKRREAAVKVRDAAFKAREAAIKAEKNNIKGIKVEKKNNNNMKPEKNTTKDLCGYDTRLDTVGATHAFGVFLKSEEGEAIFARGRLDAPLDMQALLASQVRVKREAGEDDDDHDNEEEDDDEDDGSVDGGGVNGRGHRSNGMNGVGGSKLDPLTVGMCTKKKCKTHSGWMGILSKNVKHTMKELAADAKEKLDTETRVRANAAGRYRRKMKEDNRVVVLYHSSDEVMSDEDEEMGGQ